MQDIVDPEEVEVSLRDGKLWVNVNGKCLLRVQGIRPEVLLVDYRTADWIAAVTKGAK